MLNAKTFLLPKKHPLAIPLVLVARTDWSAFAAKLPAPEMAWAEAQGFEAAPLALLPLPAANGKLARVLVGAPGPQDDPFALGAIASRLPAGTYAFAASPPHAESVALGWCLELYKYDPFRPVTPKAVMLCAPDTVDASRVIALANAVYAVRDKVNTPANLYGPDEIEKDARALAKSHGASISVVKGEALAKGFPLIAAVGAASTRAPRLIDITWGSPRHPKVTLVGKGVVFDTGGLDIKSSSNMLLMKKDMGGAANIMGLAQLVMEEKLPLRLRVLLPVVENAISGNAFRPGDIFKSRKGITVEIGDTDAEGRLILADALALADEEKPELLIDMATLTGAARVALGPDLPPFYTDDDVLAADLHAASVMTNDPLWRLPLWRPYYSMIEPALADLINSGSGFAGSVTAALFLRRFVEHARAHVHFDIYAWVPTAKAGRPKGGESQAMRAVFALLRKRYGK
jgi:leucyl aminopeptidase